MERDLPRGGVQVKRKKTKQLAPLKAKKPAYKAQPAAKPDPPFSCEPLTRLRLVVDLRCLGVVKQISNFELRVSLPNGLEGVVPITQVNSHYSKLLRQIVEGDISPDSEEIGQLQDLFHVGQVVCCKVTEPPAGRSAAKLTLDPRSVNSSFMSSRSSHQVLLQGCIKSVEDHAYTVDLGLKHTEAVLKKTDATKLTQVTGQTSLRVGQTVQCVVPPLHKSTAQDEETRKVVSVQVDPRLVRKVMLNKEKSLPFACLQPGMLVEANIHKVYSRGMKVTFLSFDAHIHVSQQEYGVKCKQDDTVKAIVLYVDPGTKVMALSLLSHLLTPELARHVFDGVEVGDTVDVTVAKNQSQGLWVVLPNNGKGFIPRKHLTDPGVEGDAAADFSVGSTHQARVINFSYADAISILSLRPSILAKKFISYATLKPGQLVSVTVRALHEHRGMSVVLDKHIHGFIPSIHMADVPLHQPEKMFSSGNVIKCRVLVVDPERKKLILSHKKTFIKDKSQVVTSYDQLEKGGVVRGVIAKVMDTGVVVTFFNGVKGWVPKAQLSTQKVTHPERVFYQGQIVRCHVLNCSPDEEKLVLSFKLPGLPEVHAPPPSSVPDDFEIGKCVSCATITKLLPNGYEVRLDPSGCLAYLPHTHTSDFPRNCELLQTSVSVGDTIPEVVYISRGQRVSVSAKPSLLAACDHPDSIEDFSQLKNGQNVTGFIHQHKDYGIFVDILHDLQGLVPNKFITDRKVSNPDSYFAKGQTVVGRVMQLHPETSRFSLSLRIMDCIHETEGQGVDLLNQCLKEKKQIIEGWKKKQDPRGALTVGESVTVKVTEETDDGAECELANGIKCHVAIENMPGVRCKKDTTVTGIVLDVDDVVHLSLCKDLHTSVTNLLDNKCSQVREGQQIKGVVHLVTDDYVVMALKGHATGRLAYMPSKRIWNDVFGKFRYSVGQEHRIVVKQVVDPQTILVLPEELNIDAAEDVPLATRDKLVAIDYQPGSTIEGEVFRIYRNAVWIRTSNLMARCHLLNCSNDVEILNNPHETFKFSQKLSGEVIGEHNGLIEFTMITIPELMSGALVNGMVTSISKSKGLQLCLPHGHMGTAAPDELSDQVTEGTIKEFRMHQIVKCVILDNTDTHNCVITLKQSILEAPRRAASKKRKRLSASFTEQSNPKKIKDNQEEASDPHKDVIPVESKPSSSLETQTGLTIGQEVKCEFIKLHGSTLTLKIQPHLPAACDVLLASNDVKVLRKPSSHFKSKQEVVGQVLGFGNRCVDVSLIKPPTMEEGAIVNGCVQAIDAVLGISLRLPHGYRGVATPEDLYDSKIPNPTNKFKKYQVVRCYLLSCSDPKHCQVSLKRSHLGKDCFVPAAQPLGQEADEAEEEITVTTPAENSTATSFDWSGFKLPQVEEEGDDNDDDDDDDNNDNDEPVVKTRGKSKKEQEDEIRARELELLTSTEAKTVEDYEQLVLRSPNSSLVWLRYMAFQAECGEIERARHVAERGLTTINYREEQEKSNLWAGYINLELGLGSHVLAKEVLDRALQVTDHMTTYSTACKLYEQHNMYQEAKVIHETLMKKFPFEKHVWLSAGEFFHRHGQVDEARTALTKSLGRLDKKLHEEVIAKFALMELKSGNDEHGKTMFEKLLSASRRTDIWAWYIDHCVKEGDSESARRVLKKAVENLQEKKSTSLLKKYSKVIG